MTQLTYQALGNHLHLIDTGMNHPGHTGCYLLEDNGELAFIDTGSSNNVDGLLEIVGQLGFTTDAVRYVMPTHVHLDHAGGAGRLMESCPQAQLVIHHKGAPHMIDPSRLQQGATAVYGEELFQQAFGDLVPVAESRVTAAREGDLLQLGNREILFIDTPGHANHHGCFFDTREHALFTGDTFGLSYPALNKPDDPWLMATTTPVAFDPDAWFDSLERMMGLKPESVCLTHFGQLQNPANEVGKLRRSIEQHVQIALREESRGEESGRYERLHIEIQDMLLASLNDHGVTLPVDRQKNLLALDMDLNAQGLEVWLARRARNK